MAKKTTPKAAKKAAFKSIPQKDFPEEWVDVNVVAAATIDNGSVFTLTARMLDGDKPGLVDINLRAGSQWRPGFSIEFADVENVGEDDPFISSILRDNLDAFEEAELALLEEYEARFRKHIFVTDEEKKARKEARKKKTSRRAGVLK